MGFEHIIRDMEVNEEISTIRGSGIQFTEIQWLPCVSFLALLALFSWEWGDAQAILFNRFPFNHHSPSSNILASHISKGKM